MRLEWLLRYLLPYEADQGPDEFAEHTGSVAVDVEISAHRYGTEVQSEAAVVPTGDGNVLTDEYMRVALAGSRRLRLAESVVFLAVAGDNAGEDCPHLQATLLARQQLQVDTGFCVREKVIQEFSCFARAVLFFRPNAGNIDI